MRNSRFNTHRVYCSYDILKEKIIITYLKYIMECMSEKPMGYCNISNVTVIKNLVDYVYWLYEIRSRVKEEGYEIKEDLDHFYVLFKIIYKCIGPKYQVKLLIILYSKSLSCDYLYLLIGKMYFIYFGWVYFKDLNLFIKKFNFIKSFLNILQITIIEIILDW